MNPTMKNSNQNGIDKEQIDLVVSNFLEHHGIAGQKWGKQHGPPYPLDRSAQKQAKLKAKAKARQEREKEKAKKRIAKQQQKNVHAAEKAEKAAREKMEKEYKQKQKYSKTAESLYKHREMYTYQEIAEALQKFEWENRIKDYMDKDMIRAKNKADTMAKTTESVVKFATAMIDGYNVAVGVTNMLGIDTKPIRIPQYKKEDKDQDKDKK